MKVLVLAVALAFVAAAPAGAQQLERIAGDQVIVEIYGVKVRLPADLDQVSFYAFQAGEKVYGKPTFTLREALADPAKALRTFDLEERWVSIRIITMRWPWGDKLVLNRFDPATTPWSNAAELLAVTIERSTPRTPPRRGVLPGYWSAESAMPDEDGYFVRSAPIPTSRVPPEVGYRLPATLRKWPASADLIVVCRWIGGDVRTCRQSLQMADGRVRVSWGWYDQTFRAPPNGQPWSNYFPKPKWRDVDLRLHEIVAYLLIDTPENELQ